MKLNKRKFLLYLILTVLLSLIGIAIVDNTTTYSENTINLIIQDPESSGTYVGDTTLKKYCNKDCKKNETCQDTYNGGRCVENSKPKPSTDPTPTGTLDPDPSVSSLLSDLYQSQYGNEVGRYGYQYNEPDTCTDGMGRIAGTYCAPNGKRYDVAVAATANAKQVYITQLTETLTSLNQDELSQLTGSIKSSKNITSDQEALDYLLQQSLIYDETSRSQIISSINLSQQEQAGYKTDFESQEELDEYYADFNHYLTLAYNQIAGREAYITSCKTENAHFYINDGNSDYCDNLWRDSQRALNNLASTYGDTIEYQNIVSAIEAARLGRLGLSDTQDYRSLLDQISGNQELRNNVASLTQATLATTLSDAYSGCYSITSPDVRNACLARYATEEQQSSFSYDGTITAAAPEFQTLQESYSNTFSDNPYLQEVADSIDTHISDSYASSKLSYLIGQLDTNYSSTQVKQDSTKNNQDSNYQEQAISAQVEKYINQLSEDNTSADQLACRARGGIWLPLEDDPCITQKEFADLPELPPSPQRMAFMPELTPGAGTGQQKCGQADQVLCDSYPVCDQGHYPKDGLCVLDPQYETNIAKSLTLSESLFSYSQSHSLPPSSFQSLLETASLTNGTDPSFVARNLLANAQTSDCDGVTIYRETFQQFVCIGTSNLETLYFNNHPNERVDPNRQELGGKCSWPLRNCGDGLVCNRKLNQCELSEETQFELAQNFAFTNSLTNSLNSDQEFIYSLNSSLLSSNFSPDPTLVSSFASQQEQDDTFFANGGCWVAIDPVNGISKPMPMAYCQSETKDELLSTLPGRECHQQGGYYAPSQNSDNLPNVISQVNNLDHCYQIKEGTGFAGLNETPASTEPCAPGLKKFEGICREEASLAFDKEYGNGVLATRITNFNLGKSIPVFGDLLDVFGKTAQKIPVIRGIQNIAISWGTSIIRSTSPSYHQSIDTRALYNFETHNLLSDSGLDTSSTYAPLKGLNTELLSTIDQASLAREYVYQAEDSFQSEGVVIDALKFYGSAIAAPFSQSAKDNFDRLLGLNYFRSGVGIWQFASAYTGEPPISRGGASGTNAFFEYAQNSSVYGDPNASEWDKLKVTLKPAGQAAVVGADLITGLGGAGRAIIKTGEVAGSNTLVRVGTLLLTPESSVTSFVSRSKPLSAINHAFEAGVSKALTPLIDNPVTRGIADSTFARNIKNATTRLSATLQPNRYLTREIQDAFVSNLDNILVDASKRQKQTIISGIVDNLDEGLQSQARTLLESDFERVLHLSGSYASDTSFVFRNSLEQAAQVSQGHLLANQMGLTDIHNFTSFTDQELLDLAGQYNRLLNNLPDSGPLSLTQFTDEMTGVLNRQQATTAFQLLDNSKSALVASSALTVDEYATRLKTTFPDNPNPTQLAIELRGTSDLVVDKRPTIFETAQNFFSRNSSPTNNIATIRINPDNLDDARALLNSRPNHPDSKFSTLDLINELMDGGVKLDEAKAITAQLLSENHPSLERLQLSLGSLNQSSFIPENDILKNLQSNRINNLNEAVSPQEAKTISNLLSAADEPLYIRKSSGQFRISIKDTTTLDDSTRIAIKKINETLDNDAHQIADMLGWESLKPKQVQDALTLRLKIAENVGNNRFYVNTELAGFGKTSIDDLITKQGLDDGNYVIRNLNSLGAVRDVSNPRSTAELFQDVTFVQLDGNDLYFIKDAGSRQLKEGADRTLISSLDDLTNQEKVIIFTTWDESGWKAATGKGIGGYNQGDDLSRFYYELTQSNPYQLFDEAHELADRRWVIRLDQKKASQLTSSEIDEYLFGIKPSRLEDILLETQDTPSLERFRQQYQSLRANQQSTVEGLLRPDGKPLDSDLYRSTHLELIDQQLSSRSTSRQAREYLSSLRQQLEEAATLTEFDDLLRSAMYPDNLSESTIQTAINELKARHQAAETIWDLRGNKVAGNDFLQNTTTNRIEYAKRAISSGETPQSVINQFVEELEGRRIFEELGTLELNGKLSLNDFEFALTQIEMTPQELLQQGIGQTATAERIAAALDAEITGSKIPPLKQGRVYSDTSFTKQLKSLLADSPEIKDKSLSIIIEDANLPLYEQRANIINDLLESGQKPKVVALTTTDGYYLVELDYTGTEIVQKTSDLITSKNVWESRFIQADAEHGIRLIDDLAPNDIVFISERTAQFDPTILADIQPVNLLSERSAADNATQTVNRYRGFSVQDDFTYPTLDDKINFLKGKGYTEDQATKILNTEPVYLVRQSDQGIIDAAGYYHPPSEFSGLTETELKARITELNPKPNNTLRITDSTGKRLEISLSHDNRLVTNYLDSFDNYSSLFSRNLDNEVQRIRFAADLTRLQNAEQETVDRIITQLRQKLGTDNPLNDTIDDLANSVRQNRLRTTQFQQASYSRGEVDSATAFYNAVADYDTRLKKFLVDLDQLNLVDSVDLAHQLGLDSKLIDKNTFLSRFGNNLQPNGSYNLTPSSVAEKFLDTRSYDNIPYTYVASREQYAVSAPFKATSTLPGSTSAVTATLNRAPTVLRNLSRTSPAIARYTTTLSTRGFFPAIASLFSTRPSATNIAINLNRSGITATSTEITTILSSAQSLGLSTRDTYSLANQIMTSGNAISPTTIINNNGAIISLNELVNQHGAITLNTTQGSIAISNTNVSEQLAQLPISPTNVISIAYADQTIPASNIYTGSSIAEFMASTTDSNRQTIAGLLDISPKDTPITPVAQSQQAQPAQLTQNNTRDTINWQNSIHSLNLETILLADNQSIDSHLANGDTVVIVKPDGTRTSIQYFNNQYIVRSPDPNNSGNTKTNQTVNITRAAEQYLPAAESLKDYQLYVTNQNLDTVVEPITLTDLLLADYNQPATTQNIFARAWQGIVSRWNSLFRRQPTPTTIATNTSPSDNSPPAPNSPTQSRLQTIPTLENALKANNQLNFYLGDLFGDIPGCVANACNINTITAEAVAATYGHQTYVADYVTTDGTAAHSILVETDNLGNITKAHDVNSGRVFDSDQEVVTYLNGLTGQTWILNDSETIFTPKTRVGPTASSIAPTITSTVAKAVSAALPRVTRTLDTNSSQIVRNKWNENLASLATAVHNDKELVQYIQQNPDQKNTILSKLSPLFEKHGFTKEFVNFANTTLGYDRNYIDTLVFIATNYIIQPISTQLANTSPPTPAPTTYPGKPIESPEDRLNAVYIRNLIKDKGWSGEVLTVLGGGFEGTGYLITIARGDNPPTLYVAKVANKGDIPSEALKLQTLPTLPTPNNPTSTGNTYTPAFIASDNKVVIMEYVPSENLGDIFQKIEDRNTYPDRNRSLNALTQLAHYIDILSQNKWYMLDYKKDNIYIDQSGNLRVIDVGDKGSGIRQRESDKSPLERSRSLQPILQLLYLTSYDPVINNLTNNFSSRAGVKAYNDLTPEKQLAVQELINSDAFQSMPYDTRYITLKYLGLFQDSPFTATPSEYHDLFLDILALSYNRKLPVDLLPEDIRIFYNAETLNPRIAKFRQVYDQNNIIIPSSDKTTNVSRLLDTRPAQPAPATTIATYQAVQQAKQNAIDWIKDRPGLDRTNTFLADLVEVANQPIHNTRPVTSVYDTRLNKLIKQIRAIIAQQNPELADGDTPTVEQIVQAIVTRNNAIYGNDATTNPWIALDNPDYVNIAAPTQSGFFSRLWKGIANWWQGIFSPTPSTPATPSTPVTPADPPPVPIQPDQSTTSLVSVINGSNNLQINLPNTIQIQRQLTKADGRQDASLSETQTITSIETLQQIIDEEVAKFTNQKNNNPGYTQPIFRLNYRDQDDTNQSLSLDPTQDIIVSPSIQDPTPQAQSATTQQKNDLLTNLQGNTSLSSKENALLDYIYYLQNETEAYNVPQTINTLTEMISSLSLENESKNHLVQFVQYQSGIFYHSRSDDLVTVYRGVSDYNPGITQTARYFRANPNQQSIGLIELDQIDHEAITDAPLSEAFNTIYGYWPVSPIVVSHLRGGENSPFISTSISIDSAQSSEFTGPDSEGKQGYILELRVPGNQLIDVQRTIQPIIDHDRERYSAFYKDWIQKQEKEFAIYGSIDNSWITSVTDIRNNTTPTTDNYQLIEPIYHNLSNYPATTVNSTAGRDTGLEYLLGPQSSSQFITTSLSSTHRLIFSQGQLYIDRGNGWEMITVGEIFQLEDKYFRREANNTFDNKTIPQLSEVTKNPNQSFIFPYQTLSNPTTIANGNITYWIINPADISPELVKGGVDKGFELYLVYNHSANTYSLETRRESSTTIYNTNDHLLRKVVNQITSLVIRDIGNSPSYEAHSLDLSLQNPTALIRTTSDEYNVSFSFDTTTNPPTPTIKMVSNNYLSSTPSPSTFIDLGPIDPTLPSSPHHLIKPTNPRAQIPNNTTPINLSPNFVNDLENLLLDLSLHTSDNSPATLYSNNGNSIFYLDQHNNWIQTSSLELAAGQTISFDPNITSKNPTQRAGAQSFKIVEDNQGNFYLETNLARVSDNTLAPLSNNTNLRSWFFLNTHSKNYNSLPFIQRLIFDGNTNTWFPWRKSATQTPNTPNQPTTPPTQPQPATNQLIQDLSQNISLALNSLQAYSKIETVTSRIFQLFVKQLSNPTKALITTLNNYNFNINTRISRVDTLLDLLNKPEFTERLNNLDQKDRQAVSQAINDYLTITQLTTLDDAGQTATLLSQSFNPDGCSNCSDFMRAIRHLLSNARGVHNFGYYDKAAGFLEKAVALIKDHQRENLTIQEFSEAYLVSSKAFLASLDSSSSLAIEGERHQFAKALEEIDQALLQIEKDSKRISPNAPETSTLFDELKNELTTLRQTIALSIKQYDNQALTNSEINTTTSLEPDQITLSLLQPFFTTKLSTGPSSTYAQLTGKGITNETVTPRRQAWTVGNPDNPVALITRTNSTGTINIKLNRNIVLEDRPDVVAAINNASNTIRAQFPSEANRVSQQVSQLVQTQLALPQPTNHSINITSPTQANDLNNIYQIFAPSNQTALLNKSIDGHLNTHVVYTPESITPQVLITHDHKTNIITLYQNPQQSTDPTLIINIISYLKERFPEGFLLTKNNYSIKYAQEIISLDLSTPEAIGYYSYQPNQDINSKELIDQKIITGRISLTTARNNNPILKYGLEQFGLDLHHHQEELRAYALNLVLDRVTSDQIVPVAENNKSYLAQKIASITDPETNLIIKLFQEDYNSDLNRINRLAQQEVKSGNLLDWQLFQTNLPSLLTPTSNLISNSNYQNLLLSDENIRLIWTSHNSDFNSYYESLDNTQKTITDILLEMYSYRQERSDHPSLSWNISPSLATDTTQLRQTLRQELNDLLNTTNNTDPNLVLIPHLNQLLTFSDSFNESTLQTISRLNQLTSSTNPAIQQDTTESSIDHGDPDPAIISNNPTTQTPEKTSTRRFNPLQKLRNAFLIIATVITISVSFIFNLLGLTFTPQQTPKEFTTQEKVSYSYQLPEDYLQFTNSDATISIQDEQALKTSVKTPPPSVSYLDQITQVGIDPQVQQLIIDDLLLETPNLNQQESQLAYNVVQKYKSIANQIGYENMQAPYVNLILKGAVLQEIHDNNGVLVANVLTYPNQDASGFSYSNLYPRDLTRTYHGQIIKTGIIDRYTDNPVVTIPQTDATCWMHSLTASISLVQGQTSNNPQLLVDPFLLSELIPTNEFNQSTISNSIEFYRPLLTKTYGSNAQQALEYATINLFLQGNLSSTTNSLLNQMGYTYQANSFDTSSSLTPIGKYANDNGLNLIGDHQEILDNLTKLGVSNQANTHDNGLEGNQRFVTINLDQTQKISAMRYILESIQAELSHDTAVMLKLQPVEGDSIVRHSVLLLDIVGDYAVIGDGRTTNNYSNPTTWNEYPGIKYDEYRQAYLMPLDTLFNSTISIDTLTKLETSTPDIAELDQIANEFLLATNDFEKPTSEIEVASQLPPTTPTSTNQATTNTITINNTTTKLDQFASTVANILNNWQKDKGGTNPGEALKSGLKNTPFSPITTTFSSDFLDTTSTQRDDQEVQCVAFTDILQQSGLTSFQGQFIRLSAIGGDNRGVKTMIGDNIYTSTSKAVLHESKSYGYYRIENQEDLDNNLDSFLVIHHTDQDSSPGHIIYIMQNKTASGKYRIYDANYLYNGVNENGIRQIVADGEIRYKELTYEQIIEQYGNIGPGNQSQIASLLTQTQTLEAIDTLREFSSLDSNITP